MLRFIDMHRYAGEIPLYFLCFIRRHIVTDDDFIWNATDGIHDGKDALVGVIELVEDGDDD